MTFSASGESAKKVGKLLSQVEWLIPEEGFKIHPEKTRIFRSGRRQEVTGLVVNESLAVPRHRLREFRSLLFHIEKDGPDSKSWGQGDDVLASAMGFANFVSMVQPEKGAALKAQVAALIARFGGGPTTASTASPQTHEEPTVESDPEAESSPDPVDEPPKKKWWELF